MVLVMKCKYFIIYCFILSSYVIYVNVNVDIRLILYFMFLIEKNFNEVVVIIKRIYYDYLNKRKSVEYIFVGNN